MALTPEERSERARLAAHAKWATTDPSTGTQAARDGQFLKWLDEVDPDRTLPEPERYRRARSKQKEHMARMTFQALRNRNQSAPQRATFETEVGSGERA